MVSCVFVCVCVCVCVFRCKNTANGRVNSISICFPYANYAATISLPSIQHCAMSALVFCVDGPNSRFWRKIFSDRQRIKFLMFRRCRAVIPHSCKYRERITTFKPDINTQTRICEFAYYAVYIIAQKHKLNMAIIQAQHHDVANSLSLPRNQHRSSNSGSREVNK